MKGGILNTLLKPFIDTINRTQPACHGPIIPPNLFSTSTTHERSFIANKMQSSEQGTTQITESGSAHTNLNTDKKQSVPATQMAETNTTAIPLELEFGINDDSENSLDAVMNTSESGIPTNLQPSAERNTLLLSETSSVCSLNEIVACSVTEAPSISSNKRRSRRKNEVSGEDVLQNWDKPLLMRLRPHRAAGYDKNDHAIDHPRFKLVKINRRSHFEKVQQEAEKTTAFSKRRKPKQ